jgi:uncharacterized membrane protein YesL
MSGLAERRRDFGEGPLARAAALIYNLLLVELLLLVTAAPGLVPLVLLDRAASNLPLAAACALPLGPALSAALYTLDRRQQNLTDLKPVTAFWHGYRMNFWAVVRVWVAWLAWMTIIAVNLAYFAAAGVPGWWGLLLVIVAVAATLWAANALVITSLFAFRTADVARLAAYFLIRTRGVTLGNAGLLVVAVAVTAVSSEAVLALLASMFVFALGWTCRPMTTQIQKEFIA